MIILDNGTNFIDAQNELYELRMLLEGTAQGYQIHQKDMMFEETFYTLLVQIESCLNSQPVIPLSFDPDDLNPLIPDHFLIGDALTAIPENERSRSTASTDIN